MIKNENVKIKSINGRVLSLECDGAAIADTVLVGSAALPGTVISLSDGECTALMHEDTYGIGMSESASIHDSMSEILLGPGVMGGIYDALARPLGAMGEHIEASSLLPTVDENRRWYIDFTVSEDDVLVSGQAFARVEENGFVSVLCVPVGKSGRVISLEKSGEYPAYYTLAVLKDSMGELHELSMLQSKKISEHTTACKRILPKKLFKTNNAVIDSRYPIACGSSAVVLTDSFDLRRRFMSDIVKNSNADVIVYANCNAPANNVAFVKKELDSVGKMSNSVIFSGAKGMPCVDCEMAAYSALVTASYYRDMGLDVLVMLDSLDGMLSACREKADLCEQDFDAHAVILSIYDYVGAYQTPNGDIGALTLISFADDDKSGMSGVRICFDRDGITENSYSRYICDIEKAGQG
jgi:V/A-type H+-transporting ATPase subunit A